MTSSSADQLIVPSRPDFVSTFKYRGFVLKCAQCVVQTPPVSPKILSRSGGARMSLPTTDFLNPGAYCSTQSNTEETDKHILYHWNRLISIHTFKSFIHFLKHFQNCTIRHFKKYMASTYDCSQLNSCFQKVDNLVLFPLSHSVYAWVIHLAGVLAVWRHKKSQIAARYQCPRRPLCPGLSTPCPLCGKGWTGWTVTPRGSQGEPESDPTRRGWSSPA